MVDFFIFFKSQYLTTNVNIGEYFMEHFLLENKLNGDILFLNYSILHCSRDYSTESHCWDFEKLSGLLNKFNQYSLT